MGANGVRPQASSEDPAAFRESVIRFVRSLNTGVPGEYRMSPGGHVTLYASCFAAMTLHYLDALAVLAEGESQSWAEYIRKWQDPKTGWFLGPELSEGELRSRRHDLTHLSMHLTAHVLPTLDLLETTPAHPLTEARKYTDLDHLDQWLAQRDWRDAWLEGNNLLFVGQFLLYLRDRERVAAAQNALERLFDWLDREQDPTTGLWGTNGFCDPFDALYGGYHQLLLYYYCGRTVPRAEAIIDTVLKLQHRDGTFTRRGGGGACEDVDAVDVLVNLSQRTGYRRRRVRTALNAILQRVLATHHPEGGFVYRLNQPYQYMGMARTRTDRNVPHLFATWFRVHTIALITQVLQTHPLARLDWRFNPSLSMGWYAPVSPSSPERGTHLTDYLPFSAQRMLWMLRYLRPYHARRVFRHLIGRGSAGKAA